VSAAPELPAPRYGSAARLAVDPGLGVKTVHRLVESGRVRGLKVGRRLLTPFEDLDRLVTGQAGSPTVGSNPVMATTPKATTEGPHLPPVSDEEQARRNRAAIARLDAWEAEGDEQEQRETMEILRQALGRGRVAASRNLFP
jgi:hypothetical protein